MNDLNQRLATLADEMTDTDYTALRGRVTSTARRLGHRRAAVTSVAALAFVGAVAISGLQLVPQAHNTPLPGASTGVASPTPSSSPSSSPSAGASPSASEGTAVAPPAGQPEHVPGRLVYLRVGAEIEVVTVTDGQVRTTSFGARKLGDQVATVSPDGSRVALVHPTKDLSTYPGDLVIVKPGGARTVVKRDVSWGGGNEPVWMPDSRRLLIAVTPIKDNAVTGESYGYVDAASGKYDQLGLDSFPKYLSWSANGSHRAHADRNTIVVAGANGSTVRRFSVADQPECDHECPIAVQAISNDGRYVATARGGTDPTRVTGARVVFDTTTGRRIALPRTINGVTEIFFRADNSLVVQTSNKLYLVSLTGNITATIDRPDPTNMADLWRYLDH